MPGEQFQSFIKRITKKLTKNGKINNVAVLFQALKAIPGGLEMASVAILENAYNKLISVENVKAVENLPKGGYLLLGADQINNPHDRNLAVVRDQEGNYFVYLMVAEQRFDGTMHTDIELQQGKDNRCLITLEIGGERLKLCAQITSKLDVDPPEKTTETDSVMPSGDISDELSEIKDFNVLPDTHTVYMLGKRIQFAQHVQHDFVQVTYSPLEDGTSVPFNSVVNGTTEVKAISQTKLRVFLSIVEQLELLHKNDYVLRDFKPENILFTSDEITNQDKPYIIDYAEFVKLINSQPTTSTFVGTPEYLAPETQKILLQYANPDVREVISQRLETTFGSCYTEVKEASKMFSTNATVDETVETEIADDFPVDKSIDIYALGIMLYECITLKRMSYKVGEQKYNKDGTPMYNKDEAHTYYSTDGTPMCSTGSPILWTKQEIIDQLQHDKEFVANQPLLSKMLAADPKQRCSIEDVKQILTAMLEESKRLNPESDLKISEKNATAPTIESLLKKYESDPSDINKKALFSYAENLQRSSLQQTTEPSEIAWCKTKIEEFKESLKEYTEKFLQLKNSKQQEEKATRTSYKYKSAVAPSLATTIAKKEHIKQLRIRIEHYDTMIGNLGTALSYRGRYSRSGTS